MTSCPSTDRLLDLLSPATRDLEARAHVQGCARCRSELRILQELTDAFEDRVHVPEPLVARTLSAIEGLAPVERKPRPRTVPILLAWVLGTSTSLAVLVVVDPPSDGGPLTQLLYGVALGLLVALHFWQRPSEPELA